MSATSKNSKPQTRTNSKLNLPQTDHKTNQGEHTNIIPIQKTFMSLGAPHIRRSGAHTKRIQCSTAVDGRRSSVDGVVSRRRQGNAYKTNVFLMRIQAQQRTTLVL